MMRRILSRITWLAAAAALLAACGSNLPPAQRAQGEAEHLQAYCRRAGMGGPEVLRADSLLTSAQSRLKDGDEGPARTQAELAGILYRLALAHKDMADNGAQVDALKQALAKDKDQLQTYQQVLEEMNSRRRP